MCLFLLCIAHDKSYQIQGEIIFVDYIDTRFCCQRHAYNSRRAGEITVLSDCFIDD
jgi:hypothetical protein